MKMPSVRVPYPSVCYCTLRALLKELEVPGTSPLFSLRDSEHVFVVHGAPSFLEILPVVNAPHLEQYKIGSPV